MTHSDLFDFTITDADGVVVCKGTTMFDHSAEDQTLHREVAPDGHYHDGCSWAPVPPAPPEGGCTFHGREGWQDRRCATTKKSDATRIRHAAVESLRLPQIREAIQLAQDAGANLVDLRNDQGDWEQLTLAEARQLLRVRSALARKHIQTERNAHQQIDNT